MQRLIFEKLPGCEPIARKASQVAIVGDGGCGENALDAEMFVDTRGRHESLAWRGNRKAADIWGDAIVTSAESSYLFLLASLSLSFVGFSAVVVTLRGALGGELSDRHLRLVRLYIEGGLLVTALALLPALLNLLNIPDAIAWPLASAVAAAALSYILFIQFRRRRMIEAGRFPAWVIITYALSILAVAGLWLNLGIAYRPNAGPYALALTWALCVFGFIFVRTIELFLHRAPNT